MVEIFRHRQLDAPDRSYEKHKMPFRSKALVWASVEDPQA